MGRRRDPSRLKHGIVKESAGRLQQSIPEKGKADQGAAVPFEGIFSETVLSPRHVFQGRDTLNGLLKNSIAGRPVKNDEMQGGRILRNEAYNQYAARTKDEARRR